MRHALEENPANLDDEDQKKSDLQNRAEHFEEGYLRHHSRQERNGNETKKTGITP